MKVYDDCIHHNTDFRNVSGINLVNSCQNMKACGIVEDSVATIMLTLQKRASPISRAVSTVFPEEFSGAKDCNIKTMKDLISELLEVLEHLSQATDNLPKISDTLFPMSHGSPPTKNVPFPCALPPSRSFLPISTEICHSNLAKGANTIKHKRESAIHVTWSQSVSDLISAGCEILSKGSILYNTLSPHYSTDLLSELKFSDAPLAKLLIKVCGRITYSESYISYIDNQQGPAIESFLQKAGFKHHDKPKRVTDFEFQQRIQKKEKVLFQADKEMLQQIPSVSETELGIIVKQTDQTESGPIRQSSQDVPEDSTQAKNAESLRVMKVHQELESVFGTSRDRLGPNAECMEDTKGDGLMQQTSEKNSMQLTKQPEHLENRPAARSAASSGHDVICGDGQGPVADPLLFRKGGEGDPFEGDLFAPKYFCGAEFSSLGSKKGNRTNISLGKNTFSQPNCSYIDIAEAQLSHGVSLICEGSCSDSGYVKVQDGPNLDYDRQSLERMIRPEGFGLRGANVNFRNMVTDHKADKSLKFALKAGSSTSLIPVRITKEKDTLTETDRSFVQAHVTFQDDWPLLGPLLSPKKPGIDKGGYQCRDNDSEPDESRVPKCLGISQIADILLSTEDESAEHDSSTVLQNLIPQLSKQIEAGDDSAAKSNTRTDLTNDLVVATSMIHESVAPTGILQVQNDDQSTCHLKPCAVPTDDCLAPSTSWMRASSLPFVEDASPCHEPDSKDDIGQYLGAKRESEIKKPFSLNVNSESSLPESNHSFDLWSSCDYVNEMEEEFYSQDMLETSAISGHGSISAGTNKITQGWGEAVCSSRVDTMNTAASVTVELQKYFMHFCSSGSIPQNSLQQQSLNYESYLDLLYFLNVLPSVVPLNLAHESFSYAIETRNGDISNTHVDAGLKWSDFVVSLNIIAEQCKDFRQLTGISLNDLSMENAVVENSLLPHVEANTTKRKLLETKLENMAMFLDCYANQRRYVELFKASPSHYQRKMKSPTVPVDCFYGYLSDLKIIPDLITLAQAEEVIHCIALQAFASLSKKQKLTTYAQYSMPVLSLKEFSSAMHKICVRANGGPEAAFQQALKSRKWQSVCVGKLRQALETFSDKQVLGVGEDVCDSFFAKPQFDQQQVISRQESSQQVSKFRRGQSPRVIAARLKPANSPTGKAQSLPSRPIWRPTCVSRNANICSSASPLSSPTFPLPMSFLIPSSSIRPRPHRCKSKPDFAATCDARIQNGKISTVPHPPMIPNQHSATDIHLPCKSRPRDFRESPRTKAILKKSNLVNQVITSSMNLHNNSNIYRAGEDLTNDSATALREVFALPNAYIANSNSEHVPAFGAGSGRKGDEMPAEREEETSLYDRAQLEYAKVMRAGMGAQKRLASRGNNMDAVAERGLWYLSSQQYKVMSSAGAESQILKDIESCRAQVAETMMKSPKLYFRQQQLGQDSDPHLTRGLLCGVYGPPN